MKRVLILDNDHDVLEVMQEAFSYEGFEVETIMHTDNIFAQINHYKPDVILIDYLLNGINGGELCHQIKINPATSHLPVMLVSAYPRVLQSLGLYGCDAFIAKPFDLENLIGTVKQLIAATHTIHLD